MTTSLHLNIENSLSEELHTLTERTRHICKIKTMKLFVPCYLIGSIMLLLQLTSVVLAANVERQITIMNESGRRVEIHWIHPDTGELVLQSTPDILNGASMNLNSYVSHTFEVRELPGKKTGVCEGEEQQCRVDYFTVNSNDDQSKFCQMCAFRLLLSLIVALTHETNCI